jgi:hypothetical protein
MWSTKNAKSSIMALGKKTLHAQEAEDKMTRKTYKDLH